jgi:DNA-binding NtrC family response regulator
MRSPRGSVLLVDDEEGILKTLGRALKEEGHDVTATASASEAQRLLSERPFDVFVVDHRMPGRTGLQMIRDLAAAVPEGERPQVLMMTAHATVENAIEAMKLGAYDYLQKPFEVDELLVAVRRALEHQSLSRQNRYLLSEREEEFDHYGIVGRSRAIEELLRKIDLVARSKSTVLITGETGTGKELVARAIHARSAQHDMPLIKVNCAAIPEALLESELFGHVKGAFTGATANRRGRFALADGGTIFLDEIGTLALPVQAKLLRVLQEREFEPVGGERTVSVDVRVIAATNRDLRAMVADGRFQEDLFYRLSVIPVELPPLRERAEDVPLLVDHFVRKHALRAGARIDRVAPAALERLAAYRWPGNVRELENAIERAVVLATGTVIDAGSISMLEPPAATPSGALPSVRLHENVEWAEQESVRRALQQSGGVKKDAAELLGISQRALSYYLGKYRVE